MRLRSSYLGLMSSLTLSEQCLAVFVFDILLVLM